MAFDVFLYACIDFTKRFMVFDVILYACIKFTNRCMVFDVILFCMYNLTLDIGIVKQIISATCICRYI